MVSESEKHVFSICKAVDITFLRMFILQLKIIPLELPVFKNTKNDYRVEFKLLQSLKIIITN